MAKAVVSPSTKASPMITAEVARPEAETAASVPVTAMAHACVAIRSRRRSKRSAAEPAQGASTNTPKNWAKLTRPTRRVEPVSR